MELFDMNASLEDILQNERVSKKIFYYFNKNVCDEVRSPFYRKMKLKNLIRWYRRPKTCRDRRFPAQQLLHGANLILKRREAGEMVSISLWQGSDKEGDAKVDVVLVPFLLKRQDKKEQDKEKQDKAPCVIICPGGGYEIVSVRNEGIPVAEKLNELGYSAFILNYRVWPNTYPAPQEDLIRAIRFVRANSGKLGIDPEDVTVLGFSAGGHLAASIGAFYSGIPDETHRYDQISAKPDRVVLGYPVISMTDQHHEGSAAHLLGDQFCEEMCKALSMELVVTGDYPPTYIWTCEDDQTVNPSNAHRMEAALKARGVAWEAAYYPTGGHGVGLGEGTSAQGWIEKAFVNRSQTPKV